MLNRKVCRKPGGGPTAEAFCLSLLFKMGLAMLFLEVSGLDWTRVRSCYVGRGGSLAHAQKGVLSCWLGGDATWEGCVSLLSALDWGSRRAGTPTWPHSGPLGSGRPPGPSICLPR